LGRSRVFDRERRVRLPGGVAGCDCRKWSLIGLEAQC
jgi:hypothetical protein